MNIELVGKFYDNHSLSIINRNLALQLSKLVGKELKLCITALDGYSPESGVSKKDVKVLKDLQKVELDKVDVQVRHSYPPIWRWPTSKDTKVVFIQPWEYQKAPFEWQYKFETFADALIVPSNYVANVFGMGGLKPDNLFVVPNGFNESIFNKNKDNIREHLHPRINPDHFNFVYVGNSQWRKGLDILANTWGKAFKKYDKATLIIKDNPKIYGKNNVVNEIIKLQYKTGCSKIVYIDSELSDLEMAAIYKASKVVVHPYRAEGFGMHIQEAVACGCFPIISANGPTEDFIPSDIGLRIATSRQSMNVADPNVFALKPGDATNLMSTHTFYEEPAGDDLLNKIRAVYYSHDKDKQFFNSLKDYTPQNTWKDVAQEYLNIFKSISKRTSTVRS